ncbi:MAG: GntR family transcriptional regulator [Mesorhizobium sp.]
MLEILAEKMTKPHEESDKMSVAGGAKSVNARQMIEEGILSGAYDAGEKLNEVTLASRIGVSRGTIREALRSLASMGVIEIIPNRGAFVRKLKLADVLESYDVRAQLFAYAASTVTNRLTPQMTKRLKSSVAAMYEAIEKEDAHAYHEENLRFHDLMFELSNNRKASEIYHALVREISIYRANMIFNRNVMLNSYREHEAIVDAIVAGDEEAASRLAREHIMGGKTRFVNYFKYVD